MATMHVLAEMPADIFEVVDGGQAAIFGVATANGEQFQFKVSTDALDAVLSNLERLARLALAERKTNQTVRSFRNPDIPAFLTHGNWFSVVETSDPNHLRLEISREDRSPIHIPLGRQGFEDFRTALVGGPDSQPERQSLN